jgi:hypothetical protein
LYRVTKKRIAFEDIAEELSIGLGLQLLQASHKAEIPMRYEVSWRGNFGPGGSYLMDEDKFVEGYYFVVPRSWDHVDNIVHGEFPEITELYLMEEFGLVCNNTLKSKDGVEIKTSLGVDQLEMPGNLRKILGLKDTFEDTYGEDEEEGLVRAFTQAGIRSYKHLAEEGFYKKAAYKWLAQRRKKWEESDKDDI